MTLRSLGRALPALAAVALTVLVTTPAAANNRPAVTVTPTVTGTSVEVAVEINRGTQQIALCSYVLDDGPTTGCGSATGAGKKAASYDVGLSGLAGGPHSLAVTIVLTDGGGDSGATSFTVVAGPRIFALAFSNLDGVLGYDPTRDVLIAKLVDTSGDGVLGVDDTVLTDRYPLDFVPAAFGTFGLTSHVVAHVLVASSTSVTVSDSSNRQYSLESTTGDQKYLEATAGSPRSETSLFDSFSGNDTIHAQPSAPSHPGTTVDPRISGGGATDNSFVDVVMNMP